VRNDAATNLRAPAIGDALKQAALAALVAFGLFVFLIGIRTDQGPTGALVIETRFSALAILVAAVFVGSFARVLIFGNGSIVLRVAPPVWITQKLKWAGQFAGAALLVFAIAVPFLFYNNRYLLDLGILVLTYVMLGWGLNIVVGLAGLLDLGYVAFYAVGAYSYALLAQNFGLSFWICLPLAGILAAFWGVLLGFPVLRLRGDYLAIVTLGFGEIIRLILLNWRGLTGGPNGIASIPRPSFFGLPFVDDANGFAATFGLEFSATHRVVFLYYLILVLALITNWVSLRLRRLPIGRAWEAMREDEIACRALGINTTNTKLTAFAMGAMFGGIAGAFFATRQGFISPESFNFGESALVLAIVVLGGMGSQLGIAIAAFAMLGGFELFREFEQYRMLLFGCAMVSIMIWRPRGLVATRTPSMLLAGGKAPIASSNRDGNERKA
jgi:branched-chain amino acid transport system permease protein